MDCTGIDVKLRDMGVPFTKQRLNNFLSKQKEVAAVLAVITIVGGWLYIASHMCMRSLPAPPGGGA